MQLCEGYRVAGRTEDSDTARVRGIEMRSKCRSPTFSKELYISISQAKGSENHRLKTITNVYTDITSLRLYSGQGLLGHAGGSLLLAQVGGSDTVDSKVRVGDRTNTNGEHSL